MDQSLDKLKEQIKLGQFELGQGAHKLPGKNNIVYARTGNSAHVYFQYSKTEKNKILIITESDKHRQSEVINLIKNKNK